MDGPAAKDAGVGGLAVPGGADDASAPAAGPAELGGLAPLVKVMLVNPASGHASAFGQGVAQLCAGVRATGSLNAAAKAMGMAYSKAWRVVRDTEAALGVTLLARDGARGSTLTPEGARLLDAYAEMCARLAAEAGRLCRELLGR